MIAITGATGFLGRSLVRRLAGAGQQLRCWHRPSSDLSGFGAIDAAIEWQTGELGDAAAARRLVEGADAVVHAAVQWQGPRNRGSTSHGSADVFFGANLLGSLQLFEAAFAAGVPRFVYVSSCAVHDVILDDRPLDETHPLWPLSHYGAHKAAVEAFVHSYGLGQGWPICALRPTGIYGLDHPPRKSRWFDLVGQVLRGQPVESSRGGKEVHVDDVARAIDLLLAADATRIAGQSFNCYDQYIAEEKVAQIAKSLTNSPSPISNSSRGPKHQIDTQKLRALGMTFGGDELLRATVEQLVQAHR